MKKLLALLLALALVCSLAACASDEGGDSFKVGVILVGDENEGYTYAHIEGIKTAAEKLGIDVDKQIKWKYSVTEDEACYDAAKDLVGEGCKLVISNSFGHETYMKQAAEEFSDVTFIAMTGNSAKASGLSNFKNAFTKIYESRYVSGVVAGMKLAELVENGELTDFNYDKNGNIKVGYVGAYPYAEVVSGYTAFYLGIKSIVENVSMEVTYTNSWFDITAEGEAANSLMSGGCVIIGQHADSTGAPAAVEAALTSGTYTAYSIGYNIPMQEVAPTAALTSSTNNWAVYYEYALGAAMKGEDIVTDWAEGYETGAVGITELGASCAEGTAEKVEEVEAAIHDGTLHVFDTSTFTVGGETVTSAFATDTNGDFENDADEAIIDGYYHESYFQAAPSFSLRIDGITELN